MYFGRNASAALRLCSDLQFNFSSLKAVIRTATPLSLLKSDSQRSALQAETCGTLAWTCKSCCKRGSVDRRSRCKSMPSRRTNALRKCRAGANCKCRVCADDFISNAFVYYTACNDESVHFWRTEKNERLSDALEHQMGANGKYEVCHGHFDAKNAELCQ